MIIGTIIAVVMVGLGTILLAGQYGYVGMGGSGNYGQGWNPKPERKNNNQAVALHSDLGLLTIDLHDYSSGDLQRLVRFYTKTKKDEKICERSYQFRRKRVQ